MYIGNEEVKLNLFALFVPGGLIVHIENPEELTKMLPELLCNFIKVIGYKGNTKFRCFLYTIIRYKNPHNAISVQFSRSVVSDSLQPHELQHARPPCPSPTPGVHPNPCPLSWDAIQASHPLSSPSPPAFNLSQH